MNKEDIRRSPGDFLYALLGNDDILTIASVLGPDKADIIQRKRLRQIKLLKGAYNGNFGTTEKAELSGWIKDTYEYTPATVIYKLIRGERVAGKDWKGGVYGVGSTPRNTYSNNSTYTVDASTGKLFSGETEVSGGIPIYQNDSNGNTYVSGYSYAISGTSYTTKKNDDGKYYANTYGTSAGAYYADGTAYTASKSSNFWEGLSTYYPMIQSLIDVLLNAIFKLFGSKKDDDNTEITPQNTVPKQEEFMVEGSGKSTLPIALLALAGGGLLLFGGRKKKQQG